MNNKKLSLKRTIHTCLFTIGMASTAQLHALSIAEPEAEMDHPLLMVDEVFLTADADGNRQLSLTEFYQLHAATTLLEYEMTFKHMDSDGSDDVDSEEFTRFLPVQMNPEIKEQFLNAAGDNGLLDVKAFLHMRVNAQNDGDSLLWKFALIDQNHDGELTPEEMYGPVFIEPPMPIDPPLMRPPTPIEPPRPPMVKPIEPEEPKPELIIDPVEPETPKPELMVDPIEPEAPKKPETTKPEPVETPDKPTKPETLQAPEKEKQDNIGMTSPIEPSPELLEQIEALAKKLATLESRIMRIEKSIRRTQEKMAATDNERKISRLERRLKRQAERLNSVMEKHEETTKQLQEAEQMLQ